MTTKAICDGFKICQSFLGAKIHDAKDPGKSLGPMFTQVIGTMFLLMGRYANRWNEIAGSKPTALYGFLSEAYPAGVEVDLQGLLTKFREGYQNNRDYMSGLLPADRIRELDAAAGQPDDDFVFPARTWVRLVWDYAVAFNSIPDGDHEAGERLLLSMVPLYFGRTASFVRETADMPSYEAEEVIENLCDLFEEEKGYLLEHWRGAIPASGH